jgi:alanine-glyoxylate transaminase/serine-glyoxylate transaminase/serine-pyruvate transaminase
VSADTLTVAYYPKGVDDAKFRKTMAEKYGVVVAGGLGAFKGKAFRVGHMGSVNANDILSTISATEGSLASQSYEFKAGAGIAAANRILRT